MPKFDFDIIRPYVSRLLKQEPWMPVNTTHHDLLDLNREHGPQTINNLLEEYWARFGPNGERDKKLGVYKETKFHSNHTTCPTI